ncbi:hypothetical protein SBOR_1102 [Sclerotinia borealis F-4128]|uniref:Uncharacterized protein n=1 Tax=Sclerotinia borealis (strain F-4128) TaxID=1432307 RepID=W9CV90_SCLBF|nr:hypothetical protein SBOR_1102 [Sclerotinia borealis F-4128]
MFVHKYENAGNGVAMMEASQLNNQANSLEARGDYTGAEKLFLQSLELKIKKFWRGFYPNGSVKKCIGRVVYEDGRKNGGCKEDVGAC